MWVTTRAVSRTGRRSLRSGVRDRQRRHRARLREENRVNQSPGSGTIRRIKARLLVPLLALLFLSTSDRVNVSFAALQMNAELGLTPETYGFGISIFFVGYILIQWPSLMLLQRVGMRRWLFMIALLWGAAATGMAFIQSA